MSASDYLHSLSDMNDRMHQAEIAPDAPPHLTQRAPLDETASVNLAQINADFTAGYDALHEAFELHRRFCDLGV